MRASRSCQVSYDRLDAALHGQPLDAGDAALSASHVPEAVLLTAIPAVARKTSTSFCSSEPSGDQTGGVTSSEASMLENTVRIPLDDNMQDAAQAHGWTFVNSHVNDFIGHAICQTDRWINQNNEALRRQGDLPDTDPCCGLDAVLPDVSGGWVHPNARGYQQIGGALYRQLAQQLVLHVTPRLTPSMSVANTSAGVAVFVTSEEHSLRTTGYYHAFKLLQVAQDGSLSPVGGADGFQTVGYGQQGVATYDRTGRYLVLVRACWPVARDASVGCGPAAQVRISTLVPSTPIEVKANTQTTPNVKSTLVDLTVQASWKYADAGAAHDTTSSRVTVARDGGGFLQTVTVAGRTTATREDLPERPAGRVPRDGPVLQRPGRMLGRLGARLGGQALRHPGVDAVRPQPRRDRRLHLRSRPHLLGRAAADPRWARRDRRRDHARRSQRDDRPGLPRRSASRAPVRRATTPGGTPRPSRHVDRRLGAPAALGRAAHGVAAPAQRQARRLDAHLRPQRRDGRARARRRRSRAARAAGLGPAAGDARLGPRPRAARRRTFRRPARLVRAIRLKLRLVVGRSLAGRRLSVEMAATGDDRAEQAFVAGGAIAVRRG